MYAAKWIYLQMITRASNAHNKQVKSDAQKGARYALDVECPLPAIYNIKTKSFDRPLLARSRHNQNSFNVTSEKVRVDELSILKATIKSFRTS